MWTKAATQLSVLAHEIKNFRVKSYPPPQNSEIKPANLTKFLMEDAVFTQYIFIYLCSIYSLKLKKLHNR